MSFRQASLTVFGVAALLVIVPPVLADRTPLSTGWNLFSVQQDVEMGRQMAQEAERSLFFSDSSFVSGYISALGNQLAVHAPGYRYPWEFRVYMDPAINSFALPGGVIYVSSGMVQAATTEPQLASVLAHQIAHVVLRHSTQAVSRDYPGGRFSGQGVSVADAMARLNLSLDSAPVTRYTAAQEREADVIGTQILYDARFDPRVMTQFFQRISNQPEQLRSEFMTNHPVPTNKAAVIRRELQNIGALPANLRGNSPDLRTTQNHLRDEIASPRTPSFNDGFGNGSSRGDAPPLPSNRTVTYQGPDVYLRHPDNWYVSIENGYGASIAPDGGIVNGAMAWGMRLGSYETRTQGFFGQNSFAAPDQRAGSFTLSGATDQLIDELKRSNPNMREVSGRRSRTVDGEPALQVQLTNDSPIGGREVDWLVTVMRPNGTLYYFVGVAPERDFNRYAPTFEQIVSSAQFY